MTDSHVPLRVQLESPDWPVAKAHQAARLRELHGEVNRILTAGLPLSQFARAKTLATMLDQGLHVLDGLAAKSQPLAGRGLPGNFLQI